MPDSQTALADRVALVTGGSRRIGAAIVRLLHAKGMTIALHYSTSSPDATRLSHELNSQRPGSASLFQANLLETERIPGLIDAVLAACGRLDAVVNNASTFYPTPVGSVTEQDWQGLMGINLKAALFIAQAATPHLKASRGSIVNITDVYARRPLKDHPVYCMAKAGLDMLTKSLARDLGPEIRVNAVAPGSILWPERDLSESAKHRIISRTALKRRGDPTDIAQAVLYLLRDAGYTTGATIAVDGGAH